MYSLRAGWVLSSLDSACDNSGSTDCRFRSSLIAPLFLAHFIRLRYHASPFTRQAVDDVTRRIDGLVAGKGAVENAWGTAKRFIAQWGGGRLVPQQPVPGRAGAAGGAGAGAGAANARR